MEESESENELKAADRIFLSPPHEEDKHASLVDGIFRKAQQ